MRSLFPQFSKTPILWTKLGEEKRGLKYLTLFLCIPQCRHLALATPGPQSGIRVVIRSLSHCRTHHKIHWPWTKAPSRLVSRWYSTILVWQSPVLLLPELWRLRHHRPRILISFFRTPSASLASSAPSIPSASTNRLPPHMQSQSFRSFEWYLSQPGFLPSPYPWKEPRGS